MLEPKIIDNVLHIDRHKWDIEDNGTVIIDAEDLVESIPTWIKSPDDVCVDYCGILKTDAYEIWRRGGVLWLFNRPSNLWLRLPEPK